MNLSLDFFDNKVILFNIKEIQKNFNVYSGLQTIGFKRSGKNLELAGGNGFLVLPYIDRVEKIFQENDINYTLAPNLQKEISFLRIELDTFNKKKNFLNDFKNNIFDINLFEEHKKAVENISPPDRRLKEHQLKSSFHLYHSISGANFSVPGSGKTSVVFAVYNRLKKENKVNGIFIIGPLSCFSAWEEEYQILFKKKPEINIFRGSKHFRSNLYMNCSEKEMNLTNFHTATNDIDKLSEYLSSKNYFLIIDEAHYIKNPNGDWAQSIKTLGNFSKYKAVLTGTPMPQAYSDLYNLFDFLYPNVEIFDADKKFKLEQAQENSDFEYAEQLLEKTIGPYFYRVRKKELNLSDININIVKVKMNNIEKQIYDLITSQFKELAANKDFFHKNIDLLTKLKKGRSIRLRQVFSYCDLLNTALDNYEDEWDNGELKELILTYKENEKPAKIEKLKELVSSKILSGERVLIWSNFIETIKLIENEIKNMGYISKTITGSTPNPLNEDDKEDQFNEELSRKKIAKQFNDPTSNLNILIANPAACAESISLHKECHYAIYYDLSYNTAQYLQSLDRIHRVGGSELIPSNYDFLQYENTIENEIFLRVEKKADAMRKVIDGEYPIYNGNIFEEIDAYKILLNE